MMTEESWRIAERSGQRTLSRLEYVGEGPAGVFDTMFLPTVPVREDVTGRNEGARLAPAAIPIGSPLDNVGPIPEELRKDPFPGGSVPWSIQEAEKEENVARKIMIWKVALAVSWVTTAVAVLRSFGIL